MGLSESTKGPNLLCSSLCGSLRGGWTDPCPGRDVTCICWQKAYTAYLHIHTRTQMWGK